MNLDELELSCRAHNCLMRAGIRTTEDLCNQTTEDMMRIRNLGRKCLEEVVEVMKSKGLRFREEEQQENNICQNICPCIECNTEQEDCELAKAYLRTIPKKPNALTHKLLYADGWRHECPSCKGAVGENVYHPEVTDNELYCTSCGQALLIK